MSTAEKLTIIAENQQKVYDAGYEKGKAEGGDSYYDTFWDVFQNKGGGVNYSWAFAYPKWNNTNYNPKYQLRGSATGGFANAFYSTSITNTKVNIDTYSATSMAGMFYWAKAMVTIPHLKVRATVTNAKSAFTDCVNLTSINITDDSVIACDWDISDSPLDKESILKIHHALSASASGKSCSFNKTAVNTWFTDEEWIELTNAKSNWTFILG